MPFYAALILFTVIFVVIFLVFFIFPDIVTIFVLSPHLAAGPHGAACSHLPAGNRGDLEGQMGENSWVETITV